MSNEHRPVATSYVYFIREGSDGLVKIGYSKRVHTRIRALSTQAGRQMRLLAAMPGGKAEERELHQRFADARAMGEWFRPVAELLAEIEKIAATHWRPKKDDCDRQVQFRAPDGLMDKLDAWLQTMNGERRLLVNRSELICGVLDWAAEARPEWERRAAPPRAYPLPTPAESRRAAERVVPVVNRTVELDAPATNGVPRGARKRPR
jgi:hypothetical protein